MNLPLCKICGKPLNKAQWRKGKEYKSCPNCSTTNGIQHVYYKFPDNFGITPLRASSNNPEGPQSYCIPCRGNGQSTAKKILCSEF